jgi:putative membrane protein
MNNRLAASGAVLALLLGVAACEQPGTTVSNNVAGTPDGGADEPGVQNLGAAAGQAVPTDLVTALAASDMFEIEAGKLAQAKGQDAAIKGLGGMLVEEHTKASNELKALLAQSNPPISPPTTLPPELQTKLQQLGGLSGAEFDRRWLAEQTASHQQTLTKVNAFLAAAQPGPLKDHAAKATGIIQKHLNEFNHTSL